MDTRFAWILFLGLYSSICLAREIKISNNLEYPLVFVTEQGQYTIAPLGSMLLDISAEQLKRRSWFLIKGQTYSLTSFLARHMQQFPGQPLRVSITELRTKPSTGTAFYRIKVGHETFSPASEEYIGEVTGKSVLTHSAPPRLSMRERHEQRRSMAKVQPVLPEEPVVSAASQPIPVSSSVSSASAAPIEVVSERRLEPCTNNDSFTMHNELSETILGESVTLINGVYGVERFRLAPSKRKTFAVRGLSEIRFSVGHDPLSYRLLPEPEVKINSQQVIKGGVTIGIRPEAIAILKKNRAEATRRNRY